MIKLYTLPDITVTTAGTRVQVSATSLAVTTVIFQSKNSNTGAIYYGDSSVAAASGIEVLKGTSSAISADMSGRKGGEEFDLSDFWVDAATNGDKVKVSYVTRK